jgi:hypothetical protein
MSWRVEKQYLLLVSALGLDTAWLSAIVFRYPDSMLNVRELGSHFCGRVVLSVVGLLERKIVVLSLSEWLPG